MKFNAPEQLDDLPAALLSAEPQAPKDLKPLLNQAARRLERMIVVTASCVEQLEEAGRLRAGLQDSETKQAEMQRLVRRAITEVAAKLKAL